MLCSLGAGNVEVAMIKFRAQVVISAKAEYWPSRRMNRDKLSVKYLAASYLAFAVICRRATIKAPGLASRILHDSRRLEL